MNHSMLENLYRATEEDLLYGIGRLLLPQQAPIPLIHIHYRDWPRGKLEVVRTSFPAGLVVTRGQSSGSTCDLHVSTRERIDLRTEQAGHTSVLVAPAWDARLAGITEQVACRFEADRRRCGGFLLLVQTREWEFLTAADGTGAAVQVGPILPRSFPVPSDRPAA